MPKYIIITADTNDADYVSEKNLITDDQIELVKPVVKAIKEFKPYIGTRSDWNHTHRHNFPMGDGEFIPREDLGEKSSRQLYGHLAGYDIFEEFCPYGEYGIHTIKSVEIIETKDEIKLL